MLTLISAMLATAYAPAPQVPLSVVYAAGRSVKDQSIALRAWGSGSISETDEIAYEGRTSIRIATRNYFQGGIISFEKPRDLSEDYENKSNMLRFAFLLGDTNLLLNQPAAPTVSRGRMGAGGADGGPSGGAMGSLTPAPKQESHKGMPGGGQSDYLRGLGSDTPKNQVPPSSFRMSVRQLRLIVETTDGKKSEAYVPVGTSTSSAGVAGWRNVALPLHAIRGFERTNKVIKEIAVSADVVSSIYIGDIRIVNDSTPITGEVNARNLNLALGDEVTLWANGYAGSSVLQYHWDFDAKDGIQIDAEGQTVKRKFRKPGTYTVTVTISDLYGLKQPFQTSFQVKVNP